MHKDGRGAKRSEPHLVTVSLPPLLPGRGVSRVPGSAQRLSCPPTPPPRPESSLVGMAGATPPHTPSVSSPHGRLGGSISDSSLRGPPDLPPLLHPPPALSALDSPISLTTPRTASSRTQNLYVDTPLSSCGNLGTPLVPRPPSSSAVKRPIRTVSHPVIKTGPPLSPIQTGSCSCPLSPKNSTVISTQPIKSDLKLAVTPTGQVPSEQNSIICVQCGRCRCAACALPRSLPSAWVCNNTCHCSVQSCLDYVTCLCCVKAAFYHCGEKLDQEVDKEDSWVDKPCSCNPNKWFLRWGCLALLSLPLPCLLCYPFLRGVAKCCESVYQATTRQGCRCPDNKNLVTEKKIPERPLSPSVSSTNTEQLSLDNSPDQGQKRLLG